MAKPQKIRIGDLLVEKGLITEEQLMTALAEQKQSGRKLGQMLVLKGFITEPKLMEFLSHQLGVPYVDLRQYQFDVKAVNLLPETQARRFRALVLKDEGDSLLVGMADPTDIFAYDELSRILRRPIDQAVVREADLLASVDMLYRKTQEISSIAEELHEELGEADLDLERLADDAEQANAPVVRLLRTVFEDAVRAKASDIHIEPDESVLRLRQRIDGVLQEQVMKEKRITSALVSRLKLISGLDISEKRLPQDGRFNMKVANKSIDVRISTMPTQYGESVVMRLLDQSGGILDMEHLGLPPDILKRLRTLIHRPHGMVLVTGPTGSGKTTTLYSALHELNSPEKKIITVEDPVEYRLPRIQQVQVNVKIGLSFASVLRAALRQDPDVVLVGEMRDQETAEIGLRAAMTGHFVLSTLHTNDAISTAMRLIDMGIEGYLVATSLNAVLAQRLVRRICEHCSEPDPLDDRLRTWLHAMVGDKADKVSFQHGGGCPHCNNTGYRGRIGIYELLEIDYPLADALRKNDSSLFTRAAHRQKGYRPLAQSALNLAVKGITTMEEVVRIAGDVNTSEEKPATPAVPAVAPEGATA